MCLILSTSSKFSNLNGFSFFKNPWQPSTPYYVRRTSYQVAPWSTQSNSDHFVLERSNYLDFRLQSYCAGNYLCSLYLELKSRFDNPEAILLFPLLS